MNTIIWWTIFVISIALGLLGDVAMKRAGIQLFNCMWFCIGFAAYSATSVGWFVLLRTRTLSSFGTLYPVANAIGLVALGAMLFGERIGTKEWLGIGCGAAAIVLLSWR